MKKETLEKLRKDLDNADRRVARATEMLGHAQDAGTAAIANAILALDARLAALLRAVVDDEELHG